MATRKKTTKKGLGNPAAAVVATEVLKNPELLDRAERRVDKTLRNLLITGGVVVGIIFGRKIYKRWKDNNDVQKIAGSTKYATMSGDQALAAADKLFAAMDGAGTNLTKIKEVMQLVVNEDDLNLIILKFGKRKSSWSFFGDGQTLSEWIQNDVKSASDRETYINSILRQKGIKKLF